MAAAERSAGWIVPFAIFAFVTALLAIFGAVTALFLIFDVPTLLLGTLATAAMPVPPSAASSAIDATTRAGEGRWLPRNLRR